MSRVLVIGASSFVGSHLCRGLRDDYEVIGTWNLHKVRIDGVVPLRMPISRETTLGEWIRAIRPHVVIYCAALIDDREIQKDSMHAVYVNAEAPLLIAQEVKRLGGKFIYLSTSKVFSGEHEGFYSEADEPTPRGTYGVTKRSAELNLEGLDHVFVVRLGTVYGLGSYRQSSDIISRLLKKIWVRDEQRLIFDEFRSFFSADLIAPALKRLINARDVSQGIFHLAGPDKDSYYSFAKSLANSFGLPTDSLTPVKGEEFHGSLAAAGGVRGNDLSLDGSKFCDTFHLRWPSLSESLIQLRKNLQQNF